uniref:Transmembrane protein 69 n=1 Tax=Hucho hucho TaxID=62062 RepID=A0A4W5M965_9TELE
MTPSYWSICQIDLATNSQNIWVLWTRIDILNPTEKCFLQHCRFYSQGPTWRSRLLQVSDPQVHRLLCLFALPGAPRSHGPWERREPTSPQHENLGQCLGFSALLPFLGAPLLIAVTQSYLPEVAYAQVVYGGSPAQHVWMNLGISVVPSLLAWLALHCRDNIAEGALVVIMGLGLALHNDQTLLPGYPGWLKALGTILTLVATFSLDAILTLKEMCPEKKIKTVD